MHGLPKTFPPLVLATLVAAVIWPLVATPVHPAVTPMSPRDNHPLINQELARQGDQPPPAGLKPAYKTRVFAATSQSTSRPSREVFGFVRAGSIADSVTGYTTWDFSMLTTVAYFGLHVNWDGNIISNDANWAIWKSSVVSDLIQAAHSQGVKVVVTLMLFDSSPGSPVMCSGLGWGDRTVAQVANELAVTGADGVNLDYEGVKSVCVDGQTTQTKFIALVQRMRSIMPTAYISIDTYSGSAEGNDGFFNIQALSPYTDSFFVMTYDMEYYNWAYPPLQCTSMCLGPTAPLTTYFYNDTRAAAEYTAVVPSSKVILGIPYYGRKACVGAGGPNSYPTSPLVADTYLDATGEATYFETAPGTYTAHRDTHDLLGQVRFDDWLNTTLNCTRQLYWDDYTSLAAKYDLINRYNLRGAGIFTLDYGGGAPELWCDLRDHFSPGLVPATATVAASQTSTRFTVNFAAGQGCGVSAFDVQQQDTTLNQDWMDIGAGMPPTSYVSQTYSAALIANGFQGHTYQFRVRTHDGRGYIGAWSPAAVTTVPTGATLGHAFKGLYTLDVYGGIAADDSPPMPSIAYWPGWRIARAAHAQPGPNAPQTGAVLDGYGGLHPLGTSLFINSPAYWQGWDIARDFAFLPDGSGGYVLDGYGGLHPFSATRFGQHGFAAIGGGMPPAAQGAAYWQGRDIARKVLIFDDGTGGYVLDGYGGVHAFGIGRPAPPNPTLTGSWPNWDIAHDMVLIPGTRSGYVMDGYGGLHAFAPPGQALPPSFVGAPYWPGWDIARGVWLLPSATLAQPAGYLVDGYGGVHPLGPAPVVSPTPYWHGLDLTRNLWGA
ncbi:MAG: glycoside hydrolase family 18 protein [Candidatus Dormibacteraeota bacterium]|nr:glycoside hydrolase family 18 protein [Candidatus Dormibacteraeota bacterium]